MTSPDVWVGVDLGTTGARALAADREGRVLGRGAAPLTSHRDGVRHTQSPGEWWTAAATACREALRTVRPARIGGVAVDATSGTVLLTGADGQALTPALMYDDGRAEAEAAEVDSRGGEVWRRLGYGRMQRSWGLPKLCRLLRDLDAARAPGARLTHQNDYVNRRLTGHPTPADSSHALKSGFDPAEDDWPWQVLDALGVPPGVLPPVVAPGTTLGRVCEAAAEQTGLPQGTRVTAGMTDGCAAQLAVGASEIGDVNSVLGTTLVVKGVSARLPEDPTGAVYAHRSPTGLWLPGGASSAGGRALEAAFPALSSGGHADLDAAAQRHGPAGAVAYPLPGTGERFPFAAPAAHGFLLAKPGSRTDETAPADETEHYRALLEGVAFVERLALDRLDLLGVPTDGRLTFSGGGSGSRVWNALRADVLGRPAYVREQHGSAFGMALLAASAGFCESTGGADGGADSGDTGAVDIAGASRAMVRTREVFTPRDRHREAMLASYRRLVRELAGRGWLPYELAEHALRRSLT
ncbi:sugar (pentulose or hexulose) kinase [Streptomyces sp. Amel2xB2]|uniref:FGGY-family carbohydrate kinase n=1 Tax=Streptomyces sp. Amel2xB2 TaxID=1305829 RepID=UPI000DBA16F0|nr:FGGY family carbohydrate kinase [Streptomyces sp. Amel2xB2]RAJ70074.1 sugar (pentulose or hexulose) kinase [Streptomyces sp. Amel2xB2]